MVCGRQVLVRGGGSRGESRQVPRRDLRRPLTTLVDSSALLALVDRSQDQHESAQRALAELERTRLLTHNYVVVESVSVAQRRIGLGAARDLLERLLVPIEIAWVDPDLHDAAVLALLASDRREVSLVDRVSFELMRRRNIDTAFAFDPDFERQGFTLVPPC